jgi:O-antigen ligase
MTGLSIARPFDRTKLLPAADWLLVGVALVMPWSTSLTAILLVLWLIVFVPTLDASDVRRELAHPAGWLPVLLVALGLLGMAWADVSLAERWNGVTSFLKLLVIPLLFAQFRRSDHGFWVFGGYVASCIVLLVGTALVHAIPPLAASIKLTPDNLLVRNAATQSGEFVTCIFGLLFLGLEALRRRQWPAAVVMAAVVLGMLASMFFVATGRTALAIIPVLLLVFAAKNLDVRGFAALIVGAIVLGVVAWFSSPYLRERTLDVWKETRAYEANDTQNSSGERLEFAKKSLQFWREAPLIGHGTGSIHALFIKSSAGKTGAQGSATTNPHNQTFAVAIQLGLMGAVVLWAMWIAHLLLFRGGGLAVWVGLVIVVQNIVGSFFNSHLFDFVQGWVYVVGVGVAGGMVLKRRARGSGGVTS